MSNEKEDPRGTKVEVMAPTPPLTEAVAPLMQAQAGGALVPSTLEDQYRLAKYYHHSGLMPRGLDTTEKVLVALQLCFENGLPPMTTVGKIAVINGVPSFFGELPLALVLKSSKLLKKDEWFFDQNFNRVSQSTSIDGIYGASCMVQRHGFEPEVRSFTIDDAKNAKLWGKVGHSGAPTPWTLYPKRMLQMRARSWALKDNFADVLGGIAILEYDYNAVMGDDGRVVTGDPRVIVETRREQKNIAAELNDTYLSKTQENEKQEGAE